MKYCKERGPEVIEIACSKLQNINKFESAAELYVSVGHYEEAVQCYLQIKDFEKARDVAEMVRHTELANKLSNLVENTYKSHLKSENKGTDLVEAGEVSSGLDMIIKGGNWDQALDYAARQGQETLNTYLQKYTTQLTTNGDFGNAVNAFIQFGTPISTNFLTIYKTLALEVLAECELEEIKGLRQMLQSVTQSLERSGEVSSGIYAEMEKYLLITHFVHLKSVVKQKGLKELEYKICVSLLRYTKEVRADKAFFEAGQAAKAVNQIGMAFLFMNRFWDLSEAIEDTEGGAAGLGDNNYFEGTDIPSPFDIPLPEKTFLASNQLEEIREWVLQTSVDQKIEKSLKVRSCENCENKIYEANLVCGFCRKLWEPCIVTGYPVISSTSTGCTNCGKKANKDAWNQYIKVFQNCPWCNALSHAY